MLTYGAIALRLLLAAILGGLVGLERERRNQPAGLRTHLILCLGSALAMLVSIHMGEQYSSDPGRVAAQVVSGIGFLGAGAILRLGVSVRGLTTAASIWTVAGIGLAVGAGFYWASLLATAIMLAALSVLRRFEEGLLASKGTRTLFLSAQNVPGLLGAIEESLRGRGVAVASIQLHRDRSPDQIEIQAVINVPENFRPLALTASLRDLEAVTEVEVR